MLHNSEQPASCFAVLDTGVCLVADLPFNLLMLKMKDYYRYVKVLLLPFDLFNKNAKEPVASCFIRSRCHRHCLCSPPSSHRVRHRTLYLVKNYTYLAFYPLFTYTKRMKCIFRRKNRCLQTLKLVKVATSCCYIMIIVVLMTSSQQCQLKKSCLGQIGAHHHKIVYTDINVTYVLKFSNVFLKYTDLLL